MDSNKEKKDNGFLEETIKENDWEPRNIARKSLKFIGCGILLGIGISIGYMGSKPFIKDRSRDNQPRVTKTPSRSEKALSEDRYISSKNIQVTGMKDISAFNAEIIDKFQHASESIVEISGFDVQAPYERGENPKWMPGVILSMTEQDMYIAVSGKLSGDAEYTVKFSDYDSVAGEKVSADSELDFTVLKVKKSSLKSYTLKNIKCAALSEKCSVENGEMVFAMGAPFGTVGGCALGNISGQSESAPLADGETGVIVTDLPGSKDAGGVLINEDGFLIGFVSGRLSESVLKAFRAEDILTEVEKLLAGEKIPYMGIRGCEIPENIRKREGIPNGVYVENLDKDSPAIKAGLKIGDIIVGINKKEIRTLRDLHRNILELRPGEKVTVQAKRNGTDGFVKDNYELTTGERN